MTYYDTLILSTDNIRTLSYNNNTCTHCTFQSLIGVTIVINILQVPGKFELKGHDRVRGLSSLNVQNENQYMPGQSRNNTYVSRLQVI